MAHQLLQKSAKSDFAVTSLYQLPRLVVEAIHAKAMQATAFKRNPLLPFSHTFGLNTTFCFSIAAIFRA